MLGGYYVFGITIVRQLSAGLKSKKKRYQYATAVPQTGFSADMQLLRRLGTEIAAAKSCA